MTMQESHSSEYYAVLVAVPLELTNITMSGADHTGLPRRVYQRTVATLVRGRLRPSYFGVEQVPKGVSKLQEASRCLRLFTCLWNAGPEELYLLSCPVLQQEGYL